MRKIKQISIFLCSLIAIFASSGGVLVVAAEVPDEDRRFIVGFVEGSAMYQNRLNQYLVERRARRKLQAPADEVFDVKFLVPENVEIMILNTDEDVKEIQNNDEVAYVEPGAKRNLLTILGKLLSECVISSQIFNTTSTLTIV